MRARPVLASLLLLLACAAPAYGDAFLPPKGKVWHGVAGGHTVDLFAAPDRQAARGLPALRRVGRRRLGVQEAPRAGRAADAPPLDLQRAGHARAHHAARRSPRAAATRSCGGSNRADPRARRPRLPAADGRDERPLEPVRRVRRERPRAPGPLDPRLPPRLAAHRAHRARPAARRSRSCGSPQARRARPTPRAPTPRARTGRAAAYVDWVGTDFYSQVPELERRWTASTARSAGKPFVFGEYAVWGRDDPALRAARCSRGRARGATCGCSSTTTASNPVGPFRLRRYPRSLDALRALLRSGRYPSANALGRRASTASTSGVGVAAPPSA